MFWAICFCLSLLYVLCLVDPCEDQPSHLETAAGEGAGFHEELFLGANQALAQDQESIVGHRQMSLDTDRRTA